VRPRPRVCHCSFIFHRVFPWLLSPRPTRPTHPSFSASLYSSSQPSFPVNPSVARSHCPLHPLPPCLARLPLVDRLPTMETQQRPPALGSMSQSQALPSIASLTSNLAPSEQSAIRLKQQQVEAQDARDSGNWSISQSKRKHERSPSLPAFFPCLLALWPFCKSLLTISQTRRPSRTPWDCNYIPSLMPKTRHQGTRACPTRHLRGTRFNR
jgi:hypothetical protein